VSPTTVAPGGTVTISWTGVPSPTATDWFALVPINAPDNNWLAWSYTTGGSGGSMLFTLPSSLPPGRYELRLFTNDTFVRLAVSNVITVTAIGP